MLRVENYNDINSYHRSWIQKKVLRNGYQHKMRNQRKLWFLKAVEVKGNKVIKKFYLRCHHKQRQNGKHVKSNTTIKTTRNTHNNKHTNCPAQLIVKLLAPKTTLHGFCVTVLLKHNHNHILLMADALRFRPLSEQTKKQYYYLFSQGHSPASAHLEYETNLMYSDEADLIADRSCNPKISDVYNLFNK